LQLQTEAEVRELSADAVSRRNDGRGRHERYYYQQPCEAGRGHGTAACIVEERDKLAALVDVGKHLGMFTQSVEHTGKDGDG
jgi:hypothetical protein